MKKVSTLRVPTSGFAGSDSEAPGVDFLWESAQDSGKPTFDL